MTKLNGKPQSDTTNYQHPSNLYSHLEFGLLLQRVFTVGKAQCHHTLCGFNILT